MTDRSWMVAALCAQTDPDAFFPDPGASSAPAKAICTRCAVTTECLDYALTHNVRFGVWGGLTADERHTLRRTRRGEVDGLDQPGGEAA